jgi:hypothetical protein
MRVGSNVALERRAKPARLGSSGQGHSTRSEARPHAWARPARKPRPRGALGQHRSAVLTLPAFRIPQKSSLSTRSIAPGQPIVGQCGPRSRRAAFVSDGSPALLTWWDFLTALVTRRTPLSKMGQACGGLEADHRRFSRRSTNAEGGTQGQGSPPIRQTLPLVLLTQASPVESSIARPLSRVTVCGSG